MNRGVADRVGVVCAAVLVVLLATWALACGPKSESQSAGQGDTELYIYRSDHLGVATDCAAVIREAWEVPDLPPEDLPAAAIREVLHGVGPSRRLHAPGTEPLIEYFRGVRVQNGIAFLDFDESALEYLNNAACAQAAVKAPMVRTLLDFPNISGVEFEIEGEIFRDWDA